VTAEEAEFERSLRDHPDGGIPDYVESIVGRELRVYATRDLPLRALGELGARRSWLDRKVHVLHAPGDAIEDLAPIFRKLRDAGVGFLDYGHGWPPAARFDEAVQVGLLSGSYRRVVHGVNGRGRGPRPTR